MCGYRIWGIAAAIIGSFLTYFLIGFLGINISADTAKFIAIVVGIGLYFVPFLLSKILKISNIQPVKVSLKKETWETMILVIETDCRSKGQEWIQWGEKIIGHIKEKTEKVSSPDEIITISFYEKNAKAIKKIIDPHGIYSQL